MTALDKDSVRRVFLTFNGPQVNEPVVYRIGRDFDVITNIRAASITDNFGILALDLTGTGPAIDKAVAWVRECGIHVEEIQDTVEA